MASTETRLPTFRGWQFTPEGAVVHRLSDTAVIADLHLGYEWARGAAGDCVLAQFLEETLTRLSTLLGRSAISRLIVAGDSARIGSPVPFTTRDVECLKSWLADRDVDLLVLEGNHDIELLPFGRKARAASSLLTQNVCR